MAKVKEIRKNRVKIPIFDVMVLLLGSCDSALVKSEFQATEKGYWNKDNTIEFTFSGMDTIQAHHMFINLRNDETFPYSNLFLITELDFPSGQTVADTLEYEMARPDGSWLGKGHEILGPTKKRGGPAGIILKEGYLIAQWGDIKRVDMTFSVTKSFLSTVAGMAADRGLIAKTKDRVDRYVWDGTFAGEHNGKITWEHLLQQNSDWSGELWGGKDWADRPTREGSLDDWKFRKLNEPGTVMEYNDVRVNVLAYALTHAVLKK